MYFEKSDSNSFNTENKMDLKLGYSESLMNLGRFHHIQSFDKNTRFCVERILLKSRICLNSA